MAAVPEDDEIQALLSVVRSELGDPVSWGKPVEFPNSLALCSLNSVYSLNGSSAATRNVLCKYREFRARDGRNADTDGALELLAAMAANGGPSLFASDVLENRRPLPGVRPKRLRTEGISDALTTFVDLGVSTAADLRAAVCTKDPRPKLAWLSVRGLGSMSWSYLTMNAGMTDVSKPDVMVRRFVARGLGVGDVSPGRAKELLREVARQMDVEVRSLDRAMWLHESPDRPKH